MLLYLLQLRCEICAEIGQGRVVVALRSQGIDSALLGTNLNDRLGSLPALAQLMEDGHTVAIDLESTGWVRVALNNVVIKHRGEDRGESSGDAWVDVAVWKLINKGQEFVALFVEQESLKS